MFKRAYEPKAFNTFNTDTYQVRNFKLFEGKPSNKEKDDSRYYIVAAFYYIQLRFT